MEESFLHDESGVAEMRARLAEKILDIHDIELVAVGALREMLAA